MTSKVYFVDGYVIRKNVIGAAAYLHELADADREFTRFYMHDHDKNQWAQREYEHDIVSVAYSREGTRYTWHMLSKRGVLIQRTPEGVRELPIPDADTGPGQLGYVSQIRMIGSHLYVCGFRRQVYRLDQDRWRPLHRGIVAAAGERRYGFLSIDGVSESDIYAVGRMGEIFHYDGTKWDAIDSPTSSDLNRVRCAPDSPVYACGDNGTLVYGGGNAWAVHNDAGMKENCWGVEVFDGRVYVAHLKGLLEFDGEGWKPVVTGLTPEIAGYRLHANDGLLWSFGQDDLAFTDGTKWERVICPDNA